MVKGDKIMAKITEKINQYTQKKHSRTSYCKDELFKDQTCILCGNRNNHNGLFQYDDSKELFCSKDCYHTYNI